MTNRQEIKERLTEFFKNKIITPDSVVDFVISELERDE